MGGIESTPGRRPGGFARPERFFAVSGEESSMVGGMVDCPLCQGLRKIGCPTCGGSGVLRGPAGEGAGQAPCPTCQGNGVCQCTACQGSGLKQVVPF